MISSLTNTTFRTICHAWADIIVRGENGIQLWPPVGGAHLRIKQFISDISLQNELLGTSQKHIVMIDACDSEAYTFESWKQQISEMLPLKKQSLDSFLQETDGQLCIFLTGFDAQLKKNETKTLNEIIGFVTRSHHSSVILCSELPLFDYYESCLLQLNNRYLQNMIYASLYTQADFTQFFNHLEELWLCSFASETKKDLVNSIGGHYWLLKEAARIMRSDLHKTPVAIMNEPTLVSKGLMLFKLLELKDQDTVRQILLDKKTIHPSNYLKKTKIVLDEKLNIPYWYHIKDRLVAELPSETKNALQAKLELYFTSTEREIFELLLDKRSIVTRDEIAKLLWQDKTDDHYSDWAIDQFIHRVRKKIAEANAPYKLITKRGEGFLLIETTN